MKSITIKNDWSSDISLIDLRQLKRNDILLHRDYNLNGFVINPDYLSEDIICYRVTDNIIDEECLYIWCYPINGLSEKHMTMGHFPVSYYDLISNDKWFI